MCVVIAVWLVMGGARFQCVTTAVAFGRGFFGGEFNVALNACGRITGEMVASKANAGDRTLERAPGYKR
jgi:hypothetical protein